MKHPKIRVALVGCGRIAHVHAGYLRQVPEVEFVGACDLDADARETFARRWQLPTYLDIDELLAAGQPDAVHIVTPPSSHAPLAKQLLAAGVHVLVEKPMALTAAEAAEMVAAAEAAGRHLTVDHNRWFDPVIIAARDLLASGALGDITGVDVFQGAPLAEAAPDGGTRAGHWTTGLPGGSLYDSAPHPAYLLRGFIGSVSDVRVIARHTPSGAIEELRAVVAGEKALGTFTLCSRSQPIMNRVVVFGTRATADVNLNNMTMIVRRNRKVPKIVGKVLPNLEEAAQLVVATVVNGIEFIRGRQRFYPGMGVHFRQLYRALAAGEAPPVSAREGQEVMQLLEEIWTAGQRPAGTNAAEAVG
jgi:predicted dehydrogenase